MGGEERLELCRRPGGKDREHLRPGFERLRPTKRSEPHLAAREEIERQGELRVGISERALERDLIAYHAMERQRGLVVVQAEKDDDTTGTHGIERRTPRRSSAHRVDHEIGAALARERTGIG